MHCCINVFSDNILTLQAHNKEYVCAAAVCALLKIFCMVDVFSNNIPTLQAHTNDSVCTAASGLVEALLGSLRHECVSDAGAQPCRTVRVLTRAVESGFRSIGTPCIVA